MRLFAALAFAAACGSSSNAKPKTDAAADSAKQIDSPGTSPDAALDACTSCPPPTYNDISQASHWLSYDLTNVTAASSGYNGGTFDGRYVYFASYSSTLVRYDTQSNAFTTAGSYQSFDASVIDAKALEFQGAVFDGRYVYYVPSQSSKLLRYDTQASFTSQTSYTIFDIGSLDSTLHGFEGATFDGRYIYFSPWYASGSYQSVAFQYDTQGALTASGSWKSYDLSNVDINAEGYFGTIFDGKYVSFVPLRHGSNVKNGLVVRFDTTAQPFDTAGSWTVFDTTTVDSFAAGYAGAAFDGTNLYFVPLLASSARYTTTSAFTTGSSWKSYATPVTSLEFGGFDGKYVYFGPGGGAVVTRVDSAAQFDTAGSWTSFDMSTLTPAGDRTGGMIYDGRYMYFPPGGNNEVAMRFDTKSGTVMPALPQFHGSFY